MDQARKTLSPLAVLQMLVFVLVIPFLPLLISRRWGWWEAWTYAGVTIGGFVISRVLAARRHPDLIAERGRFMRHDDIEAWDRILAPLVALGGGFIPMTAGLDAHYGWSSGFGLPLKMAALVSLLAGFAMGAYALWENRFFSGVVRIQTERGHHIVSGGPYRWVRHPGYAGGILTYLATPLLLDSFWTFLPALFLTVVLVIRTSLEDRTLRERLEGYRDYTGRVRYRLLPGVW